MGLVKHLVFEAKQGARLIDVLVEKVPLLTGRTLSTPELEKLVVQGSVYQAKKRLKDPELRITAADFLEIFYPDLPIDPFTLDPSRVVYEDDDLVVVDKPAGVNTAPSPFSDIDCLSWGVQQYLDRNRAYQGGDAGAGLYTVAVVHRLDRDTQGLVFFPKNKAAELELHAMFREHRVRKIYRAVCPVFDESALGKRRDLYRIRDVLGWRGKEQSAATTIARAEGPESGLAWTVMPHTGRPHQIRKHFASYLLPLVGDRVYAPGVYSKETPLGLACVAYRCRHPVSGQPLRIVRPGSF